MVMPSRDVTSILALQETCLPYMVRSKLKLLLRGEGDQALLTFVDEALTLELRKALLELRYSQELSLPTTTLFYFCFPTSVIFMLQQMGAILHTPICLAKASEYHLFFFNYFSFLFFIFFLPFLAIFVLPLCHASELQYLPVILLHIPSRYLLHIPGVWFLPMI